MTNEEKAKAMVETVRKSVIPRYQDEDYKNNYFDEVKECCMIMADWKDAQFAEQRQALIDKACDFLSRAIDEWNDKERHRTFYLDKEGCLRNFKKAMEE